MHPLIQTELQKLATLLHHMQQDTALQKVSEDIAATCIQALQAGKKILFAGNGGSAADAQHLAAELVVRLQYHRPGLAALSLVTDTSILTAAGNDYAFEYIFSRQIEALGQPGDIFIGISTSGRSPNILRAFETARAQQLTTIAFTGKQAPLLTDRCDLILNIPSTDTPKIQECHIIFGHIICSMIEDTLFGAEYDPMRKLTLER